MAKKIKCCFCGHEVEREIGNNPSPADTWEDHRCCDACNWNIVIPARCYIDKLIKTRAGMGMPAEVQRAIEALQNERAVN